MILVGARIQGGLVPLSFPQGPGMTSLDVGRGAHFISL